MAWNTPVNWEELFHFDTPVLEIIVRGSAIYLSLFVMLRFVLKRQAGSLGVSDLLVIVMLADAAQNGMAGDYHSVSDGVLLVATLIFWNYTLDLIGYYWEPFERLINPPPMALVDKGKMMHRNMRRELITEDDLMCALRMEGLSDLSQVKKAYLEGDGKISVIKKD